MLVADAMGDGSALARRLATTGMDVAVVPDCGVAAAAVVSDLVLVEALAAGPSGVLAVAGSHGAAAAAAHAGIRVWAVTGVGPGPPARCGTPCWPGWTKARRSPGTAASSWCPAGLVAAVAGPSGPETPPPAWERLPAR